MVMGVCVKRCSRCGETKKADEFYQRPEVHSGLTSWCRACMKASYAARYPRERAIIQARAIEWNKTHQEKRRETNRRWALKNVERQRANGINQQARRRAAHQDSDVTVEWWESLIEGWEGRCAYCGVRPLKLTQDHVRPISRGGRHMKSNLLPACQPCNSSKHNRLLSEWPRYQRQLQEVPSA